MGFQFNFKDKTLWEFVGKRAKVILTDGDEIAGKVLGFNSALDNYEGVASIDVFSDRFGATVEILENEIERIEPEK